MRKSMLCCSDLIGGQSLNPDVTSREARLVRKQLFLSERNAGPKIGQLFSLCRSPLEATTSRGHGSIAAEEDIQG